MWKLGASKVLIIEILILVVVVGNAIRSTMKGVGNGKMRGWNSQLIYQSQESFTPTTQTNPSDAWKTFTSVEAGYSLQYPANFIVTTQGDHFGREKTILRTSDFKIVIYISQMEKQQDENLMEWVNKITKPDQQYQLGPPKAMVLNSISIIYFEFLFPGESSKNYEVFLAKNNLNVIKLTLLNSDKDNNEAKRIFDQILSSFHFTN